MITWSEFSIKDFFSKCHQIRCFLRIWSHLLKKSLIEHLIFCTVWERLLIMRDNYLWIKSSHWHYFTGLTGPSNKISVKILFVFNSCSIVFIEWTFLNTLSSICAWPPLFAITALFNFLYLWSWDWTLFFFQVVPNFLKHLPAFCIFKASKKLKKEKHSKSRSNIKLNQIWIS